MKTRTFEEAVARAFANPENVIEKLNQIQNRSFADRLEACDGLLTRDELIADDQDDLDKLEAALLTGDPFEVEKLPTDLREWVLELA